MPKSVGITGNHGLLEFDPQTGQVLSTETSCSSECSCKGGGETAMAFDPKDYEKVLREAIEAAIDSPDLYVRGILYQDDMKEFVRQRLGDADGVVEKFLGIIDDPHKEPDGLGRGKQIVEDLKKQPRGTWLVIKHDFQDNRDFRFTAYISAGNGKLGGHRDTFSEIPPFEKVRDRMVGYEVYEMRQKIQQERALVAGQKALEDWGFATGQTFKNVRLHSEIKPYSTLTVEKVNHERGEVTLHCKRRGSPKLWGVTCNAAGLATYLDQAGYSMTDLEEDQEDSFSPRR